MNSPMVMTRERLDRVLYDHAIRLEWVDSAIYKTMLRAKRVSAPADAGNGSLPKPADDIDPDVSGLDYLVVNGEEIEEHSTLLWSFREAIFSILNSEFDLGWGQDYNDSSTLKNDININILLAGSLGYEWHYDSNPMTVVYYPEFSGDADFKYLADCIVRRIPCSGESALVAGDLSKLPHAVGPTKSGIARVSVPMSLWPIKPPEWSGENQDYLYGDSNV